MGKKPVRQRMLTVKLKYEKAENFFRHPVLHCVAAPDRLLCGPCPQSNGDSLTFFFTPTHQHTNPGRRSDRYQRLGAVPGYTGRAQNPVGPRRVHLGNPNDNLYSIAISYSIATPASHDCCGASASDLIAECLEDPAAGHSGQRQDEWSGLVTGWNDHCRLRHFGD